MSSPTSRTLALLRSEGYAAQVVERYCHFARRRIDLLGCGDLLALKAGDGGPLLVQVTTRDNQAARLAKALAQPGLRLWLLCGGRFEVHGWAKWQ